MKDKSRTFSKCEFIKESNNIKGYFLKTIVENPKETVDEKRNSMHQ